MAAAPVRPVPLGLEAYRAPQSPTFGRPAAGTPPAVARDAQVVHRFLLDPQLTREPLAELNRLSLEAPVESFRVDEPTLEQVFLTLTGRTLRD